MDTTKITIIGRDGIEHAIALEAGRTLMELIRDAGLPILAICGGNCICSTCHVLVEDEWTGRLPAADEEEVETLSSQSLHFDLNRSRLSCQIAADEVPEGFRARLAPEG